MSKAWTDNFSYRANSCRPSPVRDILKVVKEPGMISFAGGMPAPDVFPIDEFYEGAHLLKDDGANLLQYGTTEGDTKLRQELIKFMAPRLGREVSLDEMMITSGSQQGLDLFCWSLIDPGDVIITEEPSYMAAFNVFMNHGAELQGVPCDAEGMLVDRLPAMIEDLQKQGKKVKCIYTIVNFQNPGGMTMSVERRKALVEVSHRYNVPIFEDDPYGYVRYEGEHLPSIFSFDGGENVLYAGSFSKILAPGTRLGWLIGHKDMIRKMCVFKQALDLCSCSISQALVAEYCSKGYLEKHLPVIAEKYRLRRDAMEESFNRHLAPLGVTWVKPEGGFFFWINVPEIDCDELLKVCIEKKVVFVTGSAFCINPENGKHNARINFTFCSPEVIEEGVRRIAEAIQEVKATPLAAQ